MMVWVECHEGAEVPIYAFGFPDGPNCWFVPHRRGSSMSRWWEKLRWPGHPR